MSTRRQPAGTPAGGQFAPTGHPETGLILTPAAARNEARQRRVDHLAATTSDEMTQLRIAESGETAQRELLMRNPNLTTRVIAWIVDNRTFNPARIPEFAAHPNMTDELRARIRPW